MHAVHTTLTLEAHRQAEITREAGRQRRSPDRDVTARQRWLPGVRALWTRRPAPPLTSGQLVH